MVFKVNPSPFVRRACNTAAALFAGAALSGLFAHSASAQIVYNSINTPVTPAAALQSFPAAGINVATDDYTTTLANASDPNAMFRLTSLTFFGGVNTAGDALQFRFLDQFGGAQNALTFRVNFATAGSSLQTINVGANGIPANAFAFANGVLEVSTLNLTSQGTFAFANPAVATVGFNDPNRGGGVRSFSLSGAAVGAPEPASVALLLFGASGTVVPFAMAMRRKKA